MPEEQLPMEDLDAKEDFSYQEYPVKILETSERVTRNKRIKMCKVQWSHHTKEEVMWESEDFLHSRHPVCSLSLLEPFSFQISGRDFVLGGRAVTPHVSNPYDYVNQVFKRP